MSKVLTNLSNFLSKEILSVWIITLALAINVVAWVIPRGNVQHPDRDPLGVINLMNQLITDGQTLHYVWHGVLTLTVGVIAYSVFKIWNLSMVQLVDRCDLDL